MKDAYDLKSVKLPYLAGGMLKFFVSLVEGPLRGLLTPSLFESAGINWLRKQAFDENPMHHPVHFTGELQKEAAAINEKEWPRETSSTKGFQFVSVHDFAKAYRDGKTTPEEVAKKILDAIEANAATNEALKAFITVDRDLIPCRLYSKRNADRLASDGQGLG